MKPGDIVLAQSIKNKLSTFSAFPLNGIAAKDRLDCLVHQLVDGTRRVRYVQTIANRNFSASVTDATSLSFDPLKAAVWYVQQGDINEALWLVFLATHFGKNKSSGWKLLQAVYGGLGHSRYWTWKNTSTNPDKFCNWLKTNLTVLKQAGKFSNHRKYESIVAPKASSTCEAVTSYIDWVGSNLDHQDVIDIATQKAGSSPRALFRQLYKSLSSVIRFGRTAKFDYLTMVGKLSLINIEPDSTYMTGATGPLSGARLLLADNKKASLSPTKLSNALFTLEAHLGLPFGMQVLEDALCNWQKNPNEYTYFKG